MKTSMKMLAAVLTVAAGAWSFAVIADAASMNTHMTMKQCRMKHSLHYCAVNVHQPNTNADHSKPQGSTPQ